MKNKLIGLFNQASIIEVVRLDLYIFIFGHTCYFQICNQINQIQAIVYSNKVNQWLRKLDSADAGVGILGLKLINLLLSLIRLQISKQVMSQSADKKRSLAQRKASSTINNSCTKALYSFSKAQRFPNRMYRSVTNFSFYDVDIKKNGKRVSFSSSKRSDFCKDNGVPGPTKYNINDNFASQKKLLIQFKAGREECKANSVFQSNANPGPGNYDPKQNEVKYKKLYYSIGKKIQITQTKGRASPGPIYNIESTFLDQNKHLSIYVKRNSTRICKPKTCFPIKAREKTEPIQKSKQSDTSFVTNKGDKVLGKEGPYATQSRSKRLFQIQNKDFTPGPGHYHSFSQFIDENVEVA